MYRPSNAAWVLPPAVQIPGVSRPGCGPGPRSGAAGFCACAPGLGLPRRGPSRGGAGGATAATASPDLRPEPPGIPRGSAARGPRPRRRGAGKTADGRNSARGAGASPVGRTAARSAGGADGPGLRRRLGTRLAERGAPFGCREDLPAEPGARREARFHRQQRHEREARVPVGRDVQNVALPAFPADQEVEGVLVEVGEGHLQHARALLRRHHRRQQQARGYQDQTPHLKGDGKQSVCRTLSRKRPSVATPASSSARRRNTHALR